MPLYPKIGTLGAQDANAVDITGGSIVNANVIGGNIAVYSITAATLATLVSGSALATGQVFRVSDTNELIMATGVNTYVYVSQEVALTPVTASGASVIFDVSPYRSLKFTLENIQLASASQTINIGAGLSAVSFTTASVASESSGAGNAMLDGIFEVNILGKVITITGFAKARVSNGPMTALNVITGYVANNATHVRFIPSSGNFTSGTITPYIIR